MLSIEPQRNIGWFFVPVLLASLLLICGALESDLTPSTFEPARIIQLTPQSWARTLQQSDGREVQIAARNMSRLVQLVEDAEPRTVFTFMEDMELPSLIEIRTNRLTFRGTAEDSRTTLRCASGEGAFRVHANNTLFENLIIRDCEHTALLVENELEDRDPFDPNRAREEADRLDVTVLHVDFVRNSVTDESSPSEGEDAPTAGGFKGGRSVHAELIGCRFRGNVGIRGGAVSFSGSNLSVEDCVFLDNNASSVGGAIFASRGSEVSLPDSGTSVTISGCSFVKNRDLSGGEDGNDLFLVQNRAQSISLETDRYLDFPLPTRSGGAVYVAGFDRVSFTSSNFTRNKAVPAGGAIRLRDNRRSTITACRFERNSVLAPSPGVKERELQQGGAVFVLFVQSESELEIERCLFAHNNATYGGALHFIGPINSAFRMKNCTFRSNEAALAGGAAVFRNADTPSVVSTRFINNRAFMAGAILLTNGAGLDVVETENDESASRFIDNVARDGGAILGIGGGALRLSRVFFRGNLVERNGGAIGYLDSQASGTVTIQNVILSRNRARKGGAIYVENVSSFTMLPGALQTIENNVSAGGVDTHNLFQRNVALSGGAIYYRASNLLRNRVQLSGGRFEDNRAVSNSSFIHDGPLSFPIPDSGDGGRIQQSFEDWDAIRSTDSFGRVLLEPRSFQPCEPGGGGAICGVLSAISRRPRISLEITQCNFTNNSAVVGGALMFSTEQEVNWRARCDSSTDETESILSREPCRSLSLRNVRFESNRADAAGGAIFATSLEDVFYSPRQADGGIHFRRLNAARDEEGFVRNDVGESGYGPDMASAAERLNITHPDSSDEAEHSTKENEGNRSGPVDYVEVHVLDELGQVVSDGIVDSALSLQAEACRPGDNYTSASRHVVSAAERGVAVFEATVLMTEPGRYELTFSVRGNDVEGTSRTVTRSECSFGERFVANSSICERCPVDEFTFYDEVSDCLDCPDHAKCNGGASLVPMKGYWHSSPFSVVIHECFHEDACSYRDREDKLNRQRSENLDEFFARSNQDEFPVFTNEEYQQCADGYEGPLCGSCQDGYGHADGMACIKCGSRGTTAAVVVFLAMWQLLLLAITIRSALMSIQDMNLMVDIQQQNPRTSAASARNLPAFASRIGTLIQAATQSQRYLRLTALETSNPLQPTEEGTAAQSSEQQVTKRQHSVDSVTAAQHISESIKIFVSFFQVTSVAVNINLKWREIIKTMLNVMNSIAGFSNGATFTSMTCLLNRDDEGRSIHGVMLRIAFPVCIMLLVMAVFWLHWFCLRRRPDVTHSERRSYIRSRSIVVLLVVSFFAYQSVSEDLLGTLSCIELDADDLGEVAQHDVRENGIDFSKFSIARNRYWTEDTKVECYTKRHALLVGFLGVPGIVIFLCGLPLHLLIFLLRKRHSGELMELTVLNSHGFIYQSYEEKFVYWEVCILVRKALISAVVVFAYRLGSNLQGILALGVLITALILHLVSSPFKYPVLNALEGCSLTVSIFTLYSGIVFNDEKTSDGAKILLSVLLLVVNTALVIVFCSTVYVYTDKLITARLNVMGVVDIPKNPLGRMAVFMCCRFQQANALFSSRLCQLFGLQSPGMAQAAPHPTRLMATVESVQLSARPTADPRGAVVAIEANPAVNDEPV